MVSQAAAQEAMQQRTLGDLLSFYEENLQDPSQQEQVGRDLTSIAGRLATFQSRSQPSADEATPDEADESENRRLLKEVRRGAAARHEIFWKSLKKHAEDISEKLGLDGTKAIQVPGMQDPKGNQAEDKEKEAAGMIRGEGK
jgi:seryl-tRNA synthetase